MDFETYTRSKYADYAARLAETVAAVLRAVIAAFAGTLRLQQVQQRARGPDSLRKKLEHRGILATTSLEDEIKDLAGCRLIFYTNADVARFLQSGIIQDNFEVDSKSIGTGPKFFIRCRGRQSSTISLSPTTMW